MKRATPTHCHDCGEPFPRAKLHASRGAHGLEYRCAGCGETHREERDQHEAKAVRSYDEVAAALYCSARRVRQHEASAFSKLRAWAEGWR
jgi:DNA-directed RNA polymerase subunit RPC12/RpoP